MGEPQPARAPEPGDPRVHRLRPASRRPEGRCRRWAHPAPGPGCSNFVVRSQFVRSRRDRCRGDPRGRRLRHASLPPATLCRPSACASQPGRPDSAARSRLVRSRRDRCWGDPRGRRFRHSSPRPGKRHRRSANPASRSGCPDSAVLPQSFRSRHDRSRRRNESLRMMMATRSSPPRDRKDPRMHQPRRPGRWRVWSLMLLRRREPGSRPLAGQISRQQPRTCPPPPLHRCVS